MRSHRGESIKVAYSESQQHNGLFSPFHYTTPKTPENNGVIERKNKTLLNVVRSMICTSGLPSFFFMGRKSTQKSHFLTNISPRNSVTKTPFELWKNRKTSVFHTHLWGYKTEARPYNPQESKLDSKTVLGYFISYPDHSRGYKFYCPTHTTRVIETNEAVVIDEINYSHQFEDLECELEEIPEYEPIAVEVPITLEPIETQTEPVF